MLNEVVRAFQSKTLGEMELTTEGALFDHHHNDAELVRGHYTPAKDCSPTTLSQQLIDDLARLREDTTVIDHEPAERNRDRLARPFFKHETLLPWPPTYPPAPFRYDFYCDCPSEESSSPSLSVASKPSEIASCNEYVAVADSPNLSCNSLPRFHQGSPVFQSEPPYPAHKVISHIIGEDDPFNPFSYDLIFEDKNARRIDTLSGKIFAPIPKLPTTAALEHFEAIAFEAVVPAIRDVEKKEPSSGKNDNVFSDDQTSPSMFLNKESTPPVKETCQASAVAAIQQLNTDEGDILYQTGPKPQVKLVDDMISLLSLEWGPLKSKKIRQLWNSSNQDAVWSSSRNPGVDMMDDDDEVFEALIPAPPQPPNVYPTNKQQLSLLRVLSQDYRPSYFS